MSTAQPPQAGKILYHWPGPGCPDRCKLSAEQIPSQPYDIAIIGAGVVGCALAYELSQYRLRIAIVDRGYDVGEGTSKGNSAIIHTGFDAEPGSLESRLVTSASRQWPELAARLKIPFKSVSALMLAMSPEQLAELPVLCDKALANGVDDVQLISAVETKKLEPNVSPNVLGGLLVPRESIIDPFTSSIAYADVALANGVDIFLGITVDGIQARNGLKLIAGDGFSFAAQYVINACGLGSRQLVDAYGGEPMHLNPRRGQFLVYDSQCSHLVSRILLPIPTKQTKGMLVAPTIFGNLLAGPTAEDLPPDQTQATDTTAAGLAAVRASAIEMCPALAHEPVIAAYAGLRCNCREGSYWIRYNDGAPGIVTLAGIRSTGLTASISIAQHVQAGLAEHCGVNFVRSEHATDSRDGAEWPGWWQHPYDDASRVAKDPYYGRIICTCENISEGELRDAMQLCAGMATLDGLKRRTRVLTGRCQGFNCCVPAAEMISRHFSVPLASVTKRGPGSEFIAKCDSEPPPASAPLAPAVISNQRQFRVVIIGAGPAGIGAAVELAKRGLKPVLLVDRAPRIGGVPAHYDVHPGGVRTFVLWRRGRVVFGQQFVAQLEEELAKTNTEVWLESQVLRVDPANKTVALVNPRLGRVEILTEALVFACGAREQSSAERGWIFGHRLARQFNTMQLLQLLEGCHALPMERPAIVGSDLIAYSAAAKLQAAGATRPKMCDHDERPAAAWFERLYFRKWSDPSWQAGGQALSINGSARVDAVAGDHWQAACDGVVISGQLVPNSELMVHAGLAVAMPQRVPVRRAHELSQPGCFIAGAAVGGLHGAEWCYVDGRRAAAALSGFLR